jgi:anti-anti-sigma factor
MGGNRMNMTALPDISTSDLCGQPRCRYQIDCAGAQLHVHARSVATVLRVDGEIDASNADLVAQAIRRFSRLKAPLVIDLSHLDFLGIAGLQALLTLNREHQQAALLCRVVSGATLRRLTGVVTDPGLPIVDSVPDALRLIQDALNARHRLLARQARQYEPQRRIPTTSVVGIPS